MTKEEKEAEKNNHLCHKKIVRSEVNVLPPNLPNANTDCLKKPKVLDAKFNSRKIFSATYFYQIDQHDGMREARECQEE